jgi:hypothetical protein
MKLYGREIAVVDLRRRTGSFNQIGGIFPFVYADGRSRGVRGIRIDTGVIQVELVADRCLDIARVALNGVPLMWRSANDIAAPEFYDADGDAWLRSFFGGWMTTCGLGNFGPAGTDAWGTFGLHGRINNTPAEALRHETYWEGDRCFFEVTGTMRETKALGEILVLHRTIFAELGGATVHVRDRMVNEGSKTAPHMLLYHCNAGWPLLDEMTRVHVSHAAMRARDAAAERGLSEWNCGGPPHDTFAEQVFIHAMQACPDGKARAAIVNHSSGNGASQNDAGSERNFGFEIAFDPAALPALMTWRMLEANNYVMAVEPANTSAIEGREFAGRHGLLPLLEPGEERNYAVDLTAIEGERLSASIDMIASATATTATTR